MLSSGPGSQSGAVAGGYDRTGVGGVAVGQSLGNPEEER